MTFTQAAEPSSLQRQKYRVAFIADGRCKVRPTPATSMPTKSEIGRPLSMFPLCEDRSVEDAIAELQAAPISELRSRWCEANPAISLPMHLPRDLLIRGILWSIQCARNGGHSNEATQLLEKMADQLIIKGTIEIERSVRPKAGTLLIREWRGKNYVVEVTDSGFVFEDRAYASLSHVARSITGTRWSGPRFFGLRERYVTQRSDEEDG